MSASFPYNVVASLPHFSPSLHSHFCHKCPFFGARIDVRKSIFAFFPLEIYKTTLISVLLLLYIEE